MRRALLVMSVFCGLMLAVEQSFPIVISGSNHSNALPLSNILRISPLYPGATIGTEFVWAEGKAGRLFQTGNLGGFVNASTGSGLFAESEFAYRCTASFGLFAETSLGLGYLHVFHPREILRQNDEGVYEKAADWGKPCGMLSLCIGAGYDFAKKTRLPIAPFIRYQFFVQTPYFEVLPIGMQSLLHLGVRINWRQG
ncbi:hypothetical protein JXM67_09255 [candidate division WOR-3 bacterium]|nr:hypothetical protein [candidate division WOR-3 bacterium]